jgi:phosphoglycerate dehydrogenase-like enzyme
MRAILYSTHQFVTSHMGFLTWEALGEIAATTLASLREFEQGKALTHELKPAQQPGVETRMAA